jgi:transcriptional regulator with XRE-family HTH domain
VSRTNSSSKTRTRFGTQAGHRILLIQGRTITGTARYLGVNQAHLYQALAGRCRPNAELRAKLPELLGVPLDELFTEDALRPPLERLSRVS